MHVRICNGQFIFKVSEQASRCKVDLGHVRERRLRTARWCVVGERLTSGAYPSTSALPSKLADKELHTRDHILPVPYSMSDQGLRIHREKWTQGFHMHRRPDHVHLDDTGGRISPVYACTTTLAASRTSYWLPNVASTGRTCIYTIPSSTVVGHEIVSTVPVI
jgi:hypothetical protein